MSLEDKELYEITGTDHPHLNGQLVRLQPHHLEGETVTVRMGDTRYQIPTSCLVPREKPNYATR